MPGSFSFYLFGGLAAILMGASKTGLPGVSILAVLLMANAFPNDAKQSVGVIVPILLVGDVIAVFWFRRHADWSRVGRLFPYVGAGMAAGVAMLWYTTGNQLRPVLGWLVLGLLAVEVARQNLDWQRIPHSPWFAISVGLLAGFGTMVGNAAGPIMAVYFISQGLLKEQFIGTSAWFFFLVNASKLPLLWLLGMMTPTTLGYGALLAPLVPIGSVLGAWLLARIPQRPFDILALSLAGLAAIWLVI